ncbi:ankyrin repeat domain-containing protein [Paenibacillus sp. y28]|uniref:ankyrin repeat domain-containing protein n=1 Tax=Paenibacillus sp. y28 TaxID=3129110 RepID=UPI00301695DD
MYCSFCGKPLQTEDRFCSGCGTAVQAAAPNPEKLKRGYSIFFGQGSEYYTKQLEVRRNWNWGAFLFDFYWMLYRKMYLYGVLFLIASSVVVNTIASFFRGSGYPSIEKAIAAGLLVYFILKVVLGLAANRLYFLHAGRTIARVLRLPVDEELREKELARRGGTSLVWPVVLLVLPAVIALAAFAVSFSMSYRAASEAITKQAALQEQQRSRQEQTVSPRQQKEVSSVPVGTGESSLHSEDSQPGGAAGGEPVDVDVRLLQAVTALEEGLTKSLLQQGGNPNTVNAAGKPLLFIAAEGNKTGLVRLLLEAGAEVDDNQGNTPLPIAVRANNVEMVKLLHQYGASVRYVEEGQRSLLEVAQQAGFKDMAAVLKAYAAEELAGSIQPRFTFELSDSRGDAYTVSILADDERRTITDTPGGGDMPGDPVVSGTYQVLLEPHGSAAGSTDIQPVKLFPDEQSFGRFNLNRSDMVYVLPAQRKGQPDMLAVTQYGTSSFNLARLFYVHDGRLVPVRWSYDQGTAEGRSRLDWEVGSLEQAGGDTLRTVTYYNGDGKYTVMTWFFDPASGTLQLIKKEQTDNP